MQLLDSLMENEKISVNDYVTIGTMRYLDKQSSPSSLRFNKTLDLFRKNKVLSVRFKYQNQLLGLVLLLACKRARHATWLFTTESLKSRHSTTMMGFIQETAKTLQYKHNEE